MVNKQKQDEILQFIKNEAKEIQKHHCIYVLSDQSKIMKQYLLQLKN